ncbi:GDYXXLXY domain-containing protein [Aeromonas caviae]|uniref:GDYXXLXY domain-containing protein n=1 Tax=Aeromonas caviae TaxID=648 RepID=UPI003AF95943
MRRLAFLLTGLALLAGINAAVWRFEHAMSQGEVVLIELAPVDPRSLMQGDYMRLNYALARPLAGRPAAARPPPPGGGPPGRRRPPHPGRSPG